MMVLWYKRGFAFLTPFPSDGQFFAWGQNNHGQLGLGKEFPSQASPQRVKSLDGIPLAQVAAGGAHSFALSLSGAVFGWGKNTSGQLGLSDERGTLSGLQGRWNSCWQWRRRDSWCVTHSLDKWGISLCMALWDKEWKSTLLDSGFQRGQSSWCVCGGANAVPFL